MLIACDLFGRNVWTGLERENQAAVPATISQSKEFNTLEDSLSGALIVEKRRKTPTKTRTKDI